MNHIYNFILAALILVSGTLSNAQELDSLKEEVKSLREKLKKIDELENRLDSIENNSTVSRINAKDTTVSKTDLRDPLKILTGDELVNDEFPGSWPMFGTSLRMKVGGYVKADFLYDVDGTSDKTQFLMSTIPVEGTPEHSNSGYINMFARETRFNIDVRRVEKGAVPLRMFLEGDFWSTGNQFRLRHAYIVAGDFLIGQNWTTISILESLVFMIDFAAGDALFGGRGTQIRYQKNIDDHWKLAIGLENLSSSGIENPDKLAGAPSPLLPLLAARMDYRWKTGLAALGSSIAQLRWDGGQDGPDAKTLQFDAVVGGRQYIGNDYFTWNISYGIGAGENIMAFSGSQANAVLTPDGKLEPMHSVAFVAGFSHKWSKLISSNLFYAYGWLLDPPESRAPLALKTGGIGHLNLIWAPVQHFSTGIEFMWGAQRTTNNALGKASRLQLMAKFDF